MALLTRNFDELMNSRLASDPDFREAMRRECDIGIAAIERGEFKEFESAQALVTYLKSLADRSRPPHSDSE
jgi:hypothetical protein